MNLLASSGSKLKLSLLTTFNNIKGYLLAGLTLLSTVLFLLYRREQSKSAEAEAKQVAAQQRGRRDELEKQTKQAEQVATDSRSDYERLAAPHRKSD